MSCRTRPDGVAMPSDSSTGTVAVVGVGEVGDECLPALCAALTGSGVGVVDPASAAASLLLAVTDDHLRPALADLDDDARGSGRPWLLVRPGGRQLWLGPLLRPGTTACWHCLAQRLRANRDVERFLATRRHTTEPFPTPGDLLPAVVADAATALTTLEVLKFLGTAADTSTPTHTARIVTFDWVTLRRQDHVVVRRPQCPACGHPTPVAAPVSLTTQPAHHVDGGHRSRSATDTWNRYHHHISPITGVVPLLTSTCRGDFPELHVCVAGGGPSVADDHLARLARAPYYGVAWGAALDAATAFTRALAEAVQEHSAIRRGEELYCRTSYRRLAENAIHPNAYLLFSQQQCARGADTNRISSRREQIPAMVDDDAELDWTPVWSLTNQVVKYLPTSLCYYPIRTSARPATGSGAVSNGRAAGATLTDAVLAGALELIERDSVALWWYNRTPRPAVDVEGFDDPEIQVLCRSHHAHDRDVWVLDLTTDLGVPVFAAVSRRQSDDDQQLLVGFGADLDPAAGVLRALVEVTMLGRLTFAFESAVPAPGPPTGRNHPRYWWHDARVEQAPHLRPAPAASPAPAHRVDGGDSHERLTVVQAAIEAAGLELLVLDQTRPDIGLPVVQVIVPGLRYYRPPRLAPGRLYDVPVQLGWRQKALTEDELNPVPLLL